MTEPLTSSDFDRSPDQNTIPPSQDPAGPEGVQEAPRTFTGTLRQLGPGLIIAGSIVGSGELIATTSTGAQAGIALLWLIIIGCVIKVFVQIELGRFAITHGETTLAALNQVPGRIGRVNWILWFWIAMMTASMAQLGGILGGVGQALALAYPITGDYVEAIQTPSARDLNTYLEWDDTLLSAYDLYLLHRPEESSRGWRTSADEPGGPFEEQWRSELVERDRSTVAALANREALLASFVEAFPPVDQRNFLSAAELEERRARLRELLAEVNRPRLEADVAQRVDSGVLHERPSEMALEQIRRGHTVLAEQLVDVSQLARHPVEGRALAAQQRVRAASQELEALKSQFASASGTVESSETAVLGDAVELQSIRVRAERQQVAVLTERSTLDDKLWAAIVVAVTIPLLYNGRYGVIQNVSTVLVVLFTFVTIGNAISLQATPQFRISGEDLVRGLTFGLPEGSEGISMALATFGIIGVGATELITYPYWCIEKGYARYTGRRSSDESWAQRARGWMRVMHYDAFLSMVIYTIATIAFYLMGAAVLFREGRNPDGMRMVSTLASAYVPVFGEYAKYLFLIGAVAVLYSTFLVANAGHSRMFTDGLKVFGLMDPNSESKHRRAISTFCVILPLSCLVTFWSGINPVAAVALAGMMQATMLPMLGFAALYFRKNATDPRLAPPRWWDVLLVLSFLGLLVVGVYGFYVYVCNL